MYGDISIYLVFFIVFFPLRHIQPSFKAECTQGESANFDENRRAKGRASYKEEANAPHR